MSGSPIICFGQQPCGIFPKRFLVAKILTARKLQQEIGGRIVFFCHDSDHDPRETKTILRHRKNNEPFEINFTFANKLQRKYSPQFLKRVQQDWFDKTLFQLPAYVDRKWVEGFKQTWEMLQQTKDEGGRMKDEVSKRDSSFILHPSSFPANVADFCLSMYRQMGLLEGIEVVRSGDPDIRQATCDIGEYFVDVPFEGEIVRARCFDGVLKLHEGGNSYITLPPQPYDKLQISPTRDSRLKWMQSVIHCTHYIAGASEQDYLRKQDAPEITYINRDTIERSDEAWTEEVKG